MRKIILLVIWVSAAFHTISANVIRLPVDSIPPKHHWVSRQILKTDPFSLCFKRPAIEYELPVNANKSLILQLSGLWYAKTPLGASTFYYQEISEKYEGADEHIHYANLPEKQRFIPNTSMHLGGGVRFYPIVARRFSFFVQPSLHFFRHFGVKSTDTSKLLNTVSKEEYVPVLWENQKLTTTTKQWELSRYKQKDAVWRSGGGLTAGLKFATNTRFSIDLGVETFFLWNADAGFGKYYGLNAGNFKIYAMAGYQFAE